MAGQHAGFRSLECILQGGNSVRFETRSLVAEGVLYTLTVFAEVATYNANEALLDRVRESLVPAPAPQRRPRE
jgi:hypothetical protein